MNDQPSPVPPVSPAAPSPSKTSGLAIASLVFGILGITCILPIVGPILALVFGIIALNQISKSRGAMPGHGRAVAGLVLGCIGLVLVPILIMAAILLPALNSAREKGREAVCFSNVKQIGIACAMYADGNNGNLPQTLDSLTNFVSIKAFICPTAKDSTHYSYQFTGVTNKWGKDTNVIILREIEVNHRGRRVVLYNDGHVESQKE